MTDFSPEPFHLRNLAAQLPDRFEAGGSDPDQSLHP
jgi:hypothetical protein